MVWVMGRNVRIAMVGALVLLTGALVVQQGLGAPGPEPSIASDVRVGADDDALVQSSSRRAVDAPDGRKDHGRRDDGRRDDGRRDDGRRDDGHNDRGAPAGPRDRDRDDDGVQQVNPGAQPIDGDDGALDDTDDGGGGEDVGDDGGGD